MRRSTFMTLMSLLVCLLSLARVAANERPNVIVFLSDDQGYGDFSYTGNRDIATPNIDSLAKDGAFVSNFYVCPVCSPTRAEFLTGRYAVRCGVYSTSAGGERLDLDESTIAEAFKAAGYRTGAFGKWHNGMQAPYHPNTRGFDEFYGFCSGHWGHYFDPMLERNGEIVRGNGFCVDDFTSQAIQFIEQSKDEPFFVYLPYNTPHSPMQVPDRYWKKFKDKEISDLPPEFKKAKKGKGIKHCRAALAMCENIDHNVGRVLQKLEELKIADNTIVLYFCDNGPNGRRYNAGLKGAKGSTDEGGIHSPLFVRWPEKIKAGTTVESVTGAIDLYPTLTAACNVASNNRKTFDGISFLGELTGAKQANDEPRYFFTYWRGKSSVRWGNYRLDTNQQLYDLAKDPGQKSPVKDQKKVRQQLIDAMDQFKSTAVAELDPNSVRLFPIGFSGMKQTQIPARDGVVNGKLKRSNKFPNCSYFMNWVDTNDSITWPVEVLENGRYEVELYYCLSEENVGAELKLSCGDNFVIQKVTEAHQSPLIGAEQDRSVRGESLVKNFKPMKMGELELEKGKHELKLSTIEMPGNESIEFRMLLFKRAD